MRAVPASLAACLLACAGPNGPPEPGAELGPAAPAAADCPPVRQFANDWFYFVDLERGRTCRVFLEQDECVLGVFEDCTNRPRQWVGTVDGAGMMRLTAVHATPQGLADRGTCAGPLRGLDTPETSARLICAAGPGDLYFERVDPNAEPFGEVLPEARIEVVSVRSDAIGRLTDAAIIEVGDTRELWVVVANRGAADSAHLSIHDIVGAGPRAAIELPFADSLATVPGTGQIAVTARDRLVLVDAGRRSIVVSATVSGSIDAVAASPDGTAIYIALEARSGPPRVWIERRSSSDLTLERGPTELDLRLPKIVAADGDPRVFVAGWGFQEASRLYALSASLDIINVREFPVVGAGMTWLQDEARLGVAMQGSRYELLDRDLVTTSVIPDPVGWRPSATAQLGDKVLIASWSRLAMLDRRRSRFMQSSLTIEGGIVALPWDRATGDVFAVTGEGTVERIRIR